MRLSILVLLLAACGVTTTPPPADAPAEPAAPEGASLYDLGWTLEASEGEVRLDRYRGHPTLISMFYTSCPMACPLLIERIHTVERALSATAKAQTRVMMVSLDPANDTRAVLARTYEERALDRDAWTLARVDDDRVRELAATPQRQQQSAHLLTPTRIRCQRSLQPTVPQTERPVLRTQRRHGRQVAVLH